MIPHQPNSSAAGLTEDRELEARAIELAVIAHIRHEHTGYDELLMEGTERADARNIVRDKIEGVLRNWEKRQNQAG